MKELLDLERLMRPLGSLAAMCRRSILGRVMPGANRYVEEGRVWHATPHRHVQFPGE